MTLLTGLCKMFRSQINNLDTTSDMVLYYEFLNSVIKGLIKSDQLKFTMFSFESIKYVIKSDFDKKNLQKFINS